MMFKKKEEEKNNVSPSLPSFRTPFNPEVGHSQASAFFFLFQAMPLEYGEGEGSGGYLSLKEI